MRASERDPIEAWREVSARAAAATSARAAAVRGVPVAGARRPATFAGAGALTLAAVVVAVALAIRPSPGPSASDALASADASPSATALPSPSALVSTTADDAFRFTLTVPAAQFTTADAITPVATLAYVGPGDGAKAFHAASAVIFSITEVGGGRVMEGGTDTSCESTDVHAGADLTYPFVKAGSPTDDPTAGFDRAWYQDKVLRLPAGRWTIAAELDVSMTGCGAGEGHHLRTSAEITVVPDSAANGPVADSKADGTFRLTLTTPRAVYGPDDAIEPVATVAYLGPDAETTLYTGDPPVMFAIEELGGGRRMDPGQDLVCIETPVDQAAPTMFRFTKQGASSSLGQTWYDDPVLHLPIGTWRIRAILDGETSTGSPGCGGGHRSKLDVDVLVQVVAISPSSSETIDASATIGPSALVSSDGPAKSSISDDLFDLELSAPRSWYTPREAIEPFALLRYRGPDAQVSVGHSDPYLTFTIEQLDGDAQMTGGAADSCTVTTFTRDAAVGIPFHKAGQLGLRFDEAWFRDPVLRLPVGKWRITAMFEGGIPACEIGATQHALATSIDVTVIAGP